ncbi:ATP-binding cassette domain-containing protein [Streptomyces xiamenensis]|uniref:ATP-binding cassette domain-containing protein n=1 Tax=Streptomyces xiamenensis TaxID=408015 RepID=UPI0036E60FB2
MAEHAIVAEGLRKRYGGTYALNGFDLTVETGTLHGVLGPNGAGKTTAVRALATLLRYDAGRATVCGMDVAREPQRVRGAIGLTGQYAAVDETLSGRQNLVMFGRLHRMSKAAAGRRADELLERFDLTGAAAKSAGQYSGGMRRRLDLAASIIRTPRVLFLDEPTTGLDPRSRNEVWDAVRDLLAAGTTVLLTTQYLEEADQLADRISVVDAGRVIAEGTADELKARIGGDRVEIVTRRAGDLVVVAALLERIAGAPATTDPDTRRVGVPVTDRVAALTEVVRGLHDAGLTVEDIGTRRPTLDEAFLHLTAGRTGKTEVAA